MFKGARPFGSGAILAILSIAGIAAFDGGIAAGNAALESLLTKNWSELGYPAERGGFTIVVLAPEAEYFASSVPGTTRNSRFRAASVTKMTTAAAVMLLEQKGLLRLDDPVTARMPGRREPYLPDTPEYAIPYKARITPRLLMQHRAGVFDLTDSSAPEGVRAPFAGKIYVDWALEADPSRSVTADEQAGVLSRYSLAAAAPGERYEYSNTGYTLLAKIVERVAGEPLNAFLKREFLVPLGLLGTSFPIEGSDLRVPDPSIRGTCKADGRFADVTIRNVSSGIGAYNMITSPADAAKLVRLLVRGEAGVGRAGIAKMREFLPTDVQGVGYGLGLLNAPAALGVGLNGDTRGYETIARTDPTADVTVVAVSSFTDDDSPEKVLLALERTALEARKLLGY